MPHASRLTTFFADILAPRVCCGCEREGAWLCAECANGIAREQNATCVGCSRLSPFARTCDRCWPGLKFHGISAVARYEDRAIQRIIQTVKYAPARDVASAFALLCAAFSGTPEAGELRRWVGERGIIVPVPLHWRREAERGFNQALEIARAAVAAVLPSVPIADALIRQRSTAAQAQAPRDVRAKNVAGAFECADAAAVRGRHVVLVDDVVTTGATMSACARALRHSGAHAVWGFAVARG